LIPLACSSVPNGQAFNPGLLTDLDQLLPEFRSQLATAFRTENVVAPKRCGTVLPDTNWTSKIKLRIACLSFLRKQEGGFTFEVQHFIPK
jgi:hypothetical protein